MSFHRNKIHLKNIFKKRQQNKKKQMHKLCEAKKLMHKSLRDLGFWIWRVAASVSEPAQLCRYIREFQRYLTNNNLAPESEGPKGILDKQFKWVSFSLLKTILRWLCGWLEPTCEHVVYAECAPDGDDEAPLLVVRHHKVGNLLQMVPGTNKVHVCNSWLGLKSELYRPVFVISR